MIARLLIAGLLATAAVHGGNYTLEPTAVAAAGGGGSSAAYQLTAAATAGGAGSSARYALRGGFAGQLGGAVGIFLSATPAAIAEMTATRLAAELLMDDGSRFPLAADGIAWSVAAGAISAISADGTATAGAVYQDSAATVRGTSGSFAAELELTILDTVDDNFGPYAADDLPDAWQVRHFGPAAPRAGKFDDHDGDGLGNFLEYATGSDPADAARGELRFENGVLLRRGTPAIEFAPAANALPYRALFLRRKDARLGYRPQFSRNLATWSNATTPLEVLADDGEFEVVAVRFPVFIGGVRSTARFFRLQPIVLPE